MKKIIISLLIFITVIPLLYIILFSIFSYYKYPLMFPQNFTFNHWRDLFFNNSLFYKGLFTSILIGLINGILSTIIGFFTARGLVYYLDDFKKEWLILISFPLFIPSMALFLGIHQVILRTPFANSITGVILSHMVVSIPYTTSIAISYFSGISIEMEGVARTLGSNSFNTMRRVIIPILKPGIFLSMSICFLISNTEYFSTFLIGGGRVISFSMIMYPYILNLDYGNASTTGIIFLIINLSVFIFSDWLIRKKTIKNLLYEGR